MLFDLEKWIESKKRGDVLLERTGEFTSGYIDSVLPYVEEQLNEKIEFDNVRKKVFHLFVECIQNLFHHVDPIEQIGLAYGEPRLASLVLAIEGSFCRITTGNFICKSKESFLKEKIDYLNSLNESELKNLYRETINNRAFSDRGGAGIGMIDMARKTGNKIQYNFYDVGTSADISYFSLDVFIS